MNRFFFSLLPAIAFYMPYSAQAYEFNTFVNPTVQTCYAKGMIGLDSVINARLGVLPEHAMNLALNNRAANVADNTYSTDLLVIILDAYLWKESPHSYALNVFYNCAVSTKPIKSASVKSP